MPGLYVYILASDSRRLYSGVTNNLERRVWEHRNGFDAFTAPSIASLPQDDYISPSWYRVNRFTWIFSPVFPDTSFTRSPIVFLGSRTHAWCMSATSL